MNTGRVGDVMTKQVRHACEQDDLELAMQRMLWAGIRHLPVVRDGGLVVGVLSQHDVLERMAMVADALALGHGSACQKVANAMRVPAVTVSPDDTIGTAARRMAAEKIGCLPVVESKRLVGILTTTDLLVELGMSEALREMTRSPDVAAVMTREPVTATEDELLTAAIARMLEKNVRHLPVVDAAFMLIGILSDRDVRAAVGDPRSHLREPSPSGRTVGEVMTRAPLTLRPHQSILQAVGPFLDERIGALPVLDPAGRLVGIVSYIDVLRYMRGARVWGEAEGTREISCRAT